MSVIQNIKDTISGWFRGRTNTDQSFNTNLFVQYAKQFGVEPIDSSVMVQAINVWNECYQNSRAQIMKVVCREAAKLTLTDISLTVVQTGGSEDTIDALNGVLKKLTNLLSDSLEVGFALGGLVFKAESGRICVIAPTNFIPIEVDSDGNLWSAIFVEQISRSDTVFTKLEYHHFVNNAYMIDTVCLRSRNRYESGHQCNLSDVPQWRSINPHIEIYNIDRPLFGYFRMPSFNNIDEGSSSGISFCSPAMEYIVSFDQVFDEFKKDMATTRKVVFVNNTSLIGQNTDKYGRGSLKSSSDFTKNPIPNLIVGVSGNADSIKEFNPSCNVVEFRTALQMLLDLIAVSCGFTAGYFSFDNNRNAVTATQIESEDQVTVSTITAVRINLEAAISAAIDAVYVYKQLDENAKSATYEFSFDARDLSATPIADRDHTLSLVEKGFYPLSYFLQEYQGMSEAEAIEAMQQISKDRAIIDSVSSGDDLNPDSDSQKPQSDGESVLIEEQITVNDASKSAEE